MASNKTLDFNLNNLCSNTTSFNLQKCEIINLIIPDSDIYFGNYSTSSFQANYNLESFIYHGYNSETELYLLPTAEIDVDNFYGNYSGSNIQISKLFDIDFHNGYNFDPELSIKLNFNSNCYYSYESISELYLPPTAEIDVDNFYGNVVEVDKLFTTTKFNSVFYYGNISITDALYYSSFYNLRDSDNYYGYNSEAGLSVHTGEEFIVDFYYGINSETVLSTFFNTKFKPQPIIAGFAAYDGFGGIGGINHCSTSNLDTWYDDVSIRFNDNGSIHNKTYEHNNHDLMIDMTDVGFRPWHICHKIKPIIESDLATRARLEVDFSYGYITEGYIPQERMLLFENDNYALFENGISFVADELFPDELNFRHCTSYILPIGNDVVFEMTSNLDYTCKTYKSYYGQGLKSDLSCSYGLETDGYHVREFLSDLITIEPLEPEIFYGYSLELILRTDVVLDPDDNTRYGYYSKSGMYFEPEFAYHGYFSESSLSVPGPLIKWLTPEGCLINTYVPLTEDGDADYDAIDPEKGGQEIPPLPVEFIPFRTYVTAICIAYDPDLEEIL